MGHVIDYIVVDKKEDILYAAEDFAFYKSGLRKTRGFNPGMNQSLKHISLILVSRF